VQDAAKPGGKAVVVDAAWIGSKEAEVDGKLYRVHVDL
jgi:hypothetical protein